MPLPLFSSSVIMSNAQTISSALPTPPPSNQSTPLLDANSSTVPTAAPVPILLPTPPSSLRSPSPNSNANMDASLAMPPPPPPAPKPTRSESRRSVQFPGPPPPPPRSSSTDPSITTINDDAETGKRPRYHSGLTRPTVSRAESIPTSTSKSFTGKLQSLRKKIENELSRKRGPANGQQSQSQNAQQAQAGKKNKKAQKGTVAGLRPSPALTVPESMTVADASQLCAAKRTDCVLVVDEEEGLSGIFTAKDLAFRVRSCLND